MSNSTGLPPGPIPADIINTTAPLIFGTLFNWALFGVLSVQTYIYYMNFPDDKIWNKVLVYGCYTLEVFQTAMTAADMYFWFATGYGNLSHLGNVNISPADTPILCGLIAAVVQCFFAYRIFALTRQSYLWICILIVLTSIVQTAGAIATGVRGFKLQEYARFHENILFPHSFDVWYIGTTVCDILIAGTMLWLFYKSRKDQIMFGTQILGRLVRMIVETNSLTASMALISFIFYKALPSGNNVFIATTLIMGKLYSNTLLMTFNNRIILRSTMNKHTTLNFSYVEGNSMRARQPNEVNIEVNTFRVTSDSFGVQSTANMEAHEFDTLGETKAHELTTKDVVSAV